MQFTMPAMVLGANFYNIDGTEHCSLSVMESDPTDKSLRGYRPAKIKAASVVFDLLTDQVTEYPQQLDLLVTNRVQGGKVVQTCIGISKSKTSGSAPSHAKAG